MKFSVDQDTCIACGACAETCPQVFEVEDYSVVLVESVSAELQELALEAEEGCPVSAISHV